MPATVSALLEQFLARGHKVTMDMVRRALVESPRRIQDAVVKFRDCGVDVSSEGMRETLVNWKNMEDARCGQEDGWGTHTGQYIVLANKLGYPSEAIAHELDGAIQRIDERRVNQYLTSVAKRQPIPAHQWDAVAADFAVSSSKMGFNVGDILQKLLSRGYYFGPDHDEGLNHILRELRSN